MTERSDDRQVVGQVADLAGDATRLDRELPGEDVVDGQRAARSPSLVTHGHTDSDERVLECRRERRQGRRLDRRVEVGEDDDRTGRLASEAGDRLGLGVALGSARIGEVGHEDVRGDAVDLEPTAHDAPWLARPIRGVGERHARVGQAAVWRLDELIITTDRQPQREAVPHGRRGQDRVAPGRAADRPPGIRLDQRERVDGGIPDPPSGQPPEFRRLVDDFAVDVQEGDLLEADDVGVERANGLPDPLQPIGRDVPPPGGWEWLTRADAGPDVPRRDAERRRIADRSASLTSRSPRAGPGRSTAGG